MKWKFIFSLGFIYASTEQPAVIILCKKNNNQAMKRKVFMKHTLNLTILTALIAAGQALANPQPGLTYGYFNSSKMSQLQEYGTVADIGPMNKGDNNWGVRYSGFLTVPQDGSYTFRAEADTRFRLYLLGKKVIEGWSLTGTRICTTTLQKAVPAQFMIEYCFDPTTTAGGITPTLRLFWTPPGGTEVQVPASAYTYYPSEIEVQGNEQSRLNMTLIDGGLKPVVGVQNTQIMRVSRIKPDITDGLGYTYAHHPDIAVWKGHLYAAWVMQPIQETEGPYRVVYATSTNGFQWSGIAELFPTNISLAARFYFYHATNGRMLAFTSFKYKDAAISEAAKAVLLVREITADHQLGDVFTLTNCLTSAPQYTPPPSFTTSADAGFKAACEEALGNNLLLEQQDKGVYLGANKMSWFNDPQYDISGLWDWGKASCFYHRSDGAVVNLCKMGWASVSMTPNDPNSWSQPVQPPSLYAGSGKIWGQKTADGRYALLYHPNPLRAGRFPLVIVHGDDGKTFRDMRVVHSDGPWLRYGQEDTAKTTGAQYQRGLAEWSDDGTFADKQAIWMIYSWGKEDIWVSRIPLPLKPDETAFATDNFAQASPGSFVPGWNIYSPKWAPVAVVETNGVRSLELRDSDPYDYARAMRVFPESAKVRAELTLAPAQTNGRLEIELCDPAGKRPMRVMLTETGKVQAQNGGNVTDLGSYAKNTTLSLVIDADAAAGTYSVRMNGGAAVELTTADTTATTLQRLSLRTGTYHVVPPDWKGPGVDVNSDKPLSTPAVFKVQQVTISDPIAPPPLPPSRLSQDFRTMTETRQIDSNGTGTTNENRTLASANPKGYRWGGYVVGGATDSLRVWNVGPGTSNVLFFRQDASLAGVPAFRGSYAYTITSDSVNLSSGATLKLGITDIWSGWMGDGSNGSGLPGEAGEVRNTVLRLLVRDASSGTWYASGMFAPNSAESNLGLNEAGTLTTGENEVEYIRNLSGESWYQVTNSGTMNAFIDGDESPIVISGTVASSPNLSNIDGMGLYIFNLFDGSGRNLEISRIELIPEAAMSAYEDWADSHLLVGSGRDLDADLEPDGMDNLTEYALGGNPQVNDAATVLPTWTGVWDNGTNWLVYVHNQRTDYAERGLVYNVQSTANLASPAWTNGSPVVYVGKGAAANGFESVTNRIDMTTNAQYFLRLQIQKN